jgi:hypothetical protein
VCVCDGAIDSYTNRLLVLQLNNPR